MANLESLAWDIHQVCLEIEKETTDDASKRRALRRLDRSLQNLEGELAVVVDTRETQAPPFLGGSDLAASESLNVSSIQDSTMRPSLSQSSRTTDIPTGLATDLNKLLTLLTATMLGNDDASELILNLLDQISHLYVSFDISMAEEGTANLLQTLVGLRHDTAIGEDTVFKASSSYLMILNDVFLKQEETIVPLPLWAVLSFIGDFLSYSIETLQSERWEPSAISNEYTETNCQWRILTGFLMDGTIQLYDNRTTNDSSLQDWMTETLQEMHPDVPEMEEITKEFFSNVAKYAVELTDYALDALDGASVMFASKTSQTNDVTEFEIAEACIQDSLRHVTLATSLLKQTESWGLAEAAPKHLLSLWKTASKSFLERAGVKTALNYKDDPTLQNQVCQHLVELAELVLMKEGAGDSNLESALVITFLRAIEFPELLLDFDAPIWEHLEKFVETQSSTRKAMQAAVLTLKQEYLLPGTSEKQQQVLAIVENLLSMLGEQSGEPWDAFFRRQIGDLRLQPTNESYSGNESTE